MARSYFSKPLFPKTNVSVKIKIYFTQIADKMWNSHLTQVL